MRLLRNGKKLRGIANPLFLPHEHKKSKNKARATIPLALAPQPFLDEEKPGEKNTANRNPKPPPLSETPAK